MLTGRYSGGVSEGGREYIGQNIKHIRDLMFIYTWREREWEWHFVNIVLVMGGGRFLEAREKRGGIYVCIPTPTPTHPHPHPQTNAHPHPHHTPHSYRHMPGVTYFRLDIARCKHILHGAQLFCTTHTHLKAHILTGMQNVVVANAIDIILKCAPAWNATGQASSDLPNETNK